MNLPGPHKPDLLFVLSMDTEEEWDWSGPFPQRDFSVDNAAQLPAFQAFCERLGIRPTYLVDYAIADNPAACEALGGFAAANRCEIGAHLHPWANPPYYGETGEFESHVVNLPIEQTRAKLDALLGQLRRGMGVVPTTFRTGRWGINAEVFEALRERNLRIDSSMYPFFRNEYFNCERTPLVPYWPDFAQPMEHGRQRDVLEFPVTVGFNHADHRRMIKLYHSLSRPAFEPLRLVGIAWHLRLLRKLYLSPEVTSGRDMRPLVDFSIANGSPVLHMYLHSSSLIDHGTGLMQESGAMQLIQRNISELLAYAHSRANISFCTVSEAAALVSHRLPLAA